MEANCGAATLNDNHVEQFENRQNKPHGLEVSRKLPHDCGNV